jgi:hypothetical protein
VTRDRQAPASGPSTAGAVASSSAPHVSPDSKSATVGSPWRTVPRSPLSLSGSDAAGRERPQLSGAKVPPGQPRAARRRFALPALTGLALGLLALAASAALGLFLAPAPNGVSPHNVLNPATAGAAK